MVVPFQSRYDQIAGTGYRPVMSEEIEYGPSTMKRVRSSLQSISFFICCIFNQRRKKIDFKIQTHGSDLGTVPDFQVAIAKQGYIFLHKLEYLLLILRPLRMQLKRSYYNPQLGEPFVCVYNNLVRVDPWLQKTAAAT